MKGLFTLLMAFACFFTNAQAAQMNAEEIFNAALKMNKERKEDPPRSGGLIQRHPLLNHARGLFTGGSKLPSPGTLNEGRTWSCLQLTGLDFQTDIMEITKTRNVSFENFGAGIIKEISYGSNQVRLYANDQGELAGINTSGELYEAIRITPAGDLVMESSVQGLGWWQSFFMSLMGGGRQLDKLLKIVQKTMVTSVSNTKNGGLVFDYTICPANKVIDGVVRGDSE